MRSLFFFWSLFLALALVSTNQSHNQHQRSLKNSDSQQNDEWRTGVYTYQVDTRTLAQVRGQWIGVRMRGKLTLNAVDNSDNQNQHGHHQSQSQHHGSDSDEHNQGHQSQQMNQWNQDQNGQGSIQLIGQFTDVLFAHYNHVELPNGPRGSFPDDLKYEPYQELEKPFIAYMRGGLIDNLSVSSSMDLEAENLLKGILSSLQYDTSDRHLVGDNNFLNEKNFDGVYDKMEIDVTGQCKVKYDISPLPLDQLQRDGSLAYIVDSYNVKSGRLLSISKSNDFTDCNKRIAYHFGVPQYASWKKPAKSGEKENIINRSVVSNIITDSVNNTVYSAISIQEVHVYPVMNNDEETTVHSSVNMTLKAYEPKGESPRKPSNVRQAGNLIYRTSMEQKRNHNYDDSSDDSSSSQEDDRQQWQNKNMRKQQHSGHSGRYRRSSNNQNSDNENENSFHYNNKDRQNTKNKYNKNQRYNKYSFDSSSNEENDWEEQPDHETVPNTFNTNKVNDNVHRSDMVQSAVQKSRMISQYLQNPEKLVDNDALNYWNSLSYQLQAMSSKELRDVTKELYENQKDSNDLISQRVYRDALVEAGTQPTYNEIKNLINQDKITEEEAAQVITHLPNTLRYPTEKLMEDFFDFAVSHKVQNQQYLNTSAILAVTKLLNMAHVNYKISQSRYPTSLYGSWTNKNNENMIENKVLKYLKSSLQSAVRNEDSSKAQVYVKALGNLGHPAIFEVLGPYLEGKVSKVSTFLKRHMINNYGRVAHLYPKKARPSLYNIFKNTAEDYELRVAAVYQLMKSKPTAAMLQRMAASTNNDPSQQVRSAVQTAIRTASNLDNPQYEELAKYAAAANHLVSDQFYGYQTSSYFMNDSDDDEDQNDSYQSLNYVGSDDNIIPKAAELIFRTKLGGYVGEAQIAGSVSSVSDIFNLIKNVNNFGQQSRGPQKSGKFHSDSLKQRMNIKEDQSEPMEANLFFELMNQQRFFSVGENYIQNLPHQIQYLENKLTQGIKTDYTKLFNKVNTEIMFPLITGVPFYHSFKNPVGVTLKSNINGQVQKQHRFPTALNISGSILASYNYEYDGRIGFFCPMGDKQFTAGVQQQVKFFVPLDMKIDVDFVNNNVESELKMHQGNSDRNVYHYKIYTYTSSSNNKNGHVSSHEDIKKVGQKKYNSVQVSGDNTIGMAFEVKKSSEKRLQNQKLDIPSLQDLMDIISDPFYNFSFDNEEVSVTYKAQQSETNKVNLYVKYSNDENNSMKQNKRHNTNNKHGNLWDSVQEAASKLQKRVNDKGDYEQNEQSVADLTKQGIYYPMTSILSIAATFNGNKQAYYRATIGKSSERNGKNMQFALHYTMKNAHGKTRSHVAVAQSHMSGNSNSFNAESILSSSPKGQLRAFLMYGENNKYESSIQMNITMKESSARNKYLRSKPEADQCRHEMSEGNNLDPACQSVYYQAQTMDQYNIEVEWSNIGQQVRNYTNKVYDFVRYYTYSNLDENFVNSSRQEKNRIDAVVSLESDFSMLNVTINSPNADIELIDYEVNPNIVEYVAVRPGMTKFERLGYQASNGQLYPSCTVDRSQINTFSNLTYDYKLGNCWHVVMTAKTDNGMKETRILMKNPGQGQAQVSIVHTNSQGETIEVDMDKDGFKINNEQKQKASNKNQVEKWDSQGQNRLLNVYGQDDESIVVEIGDYDLFLYFDGDRLYLESNSEDYRNKTRGICGGMSGWRGDHVTPKNCYMESDDLTAASWVMDDHCQGEANQLSKQSKKSSCVIRDYYQSSIYVPSYYGEDSNRFEKENQQRRNNNDNDYQGNHNNYENRHGHNNNNNDEDSDEKQHQRQSHTLRETKAYNSKGKSLQRHHQYYEENGKICVTNRPLPSCPENTKNKGLTQIRVNMICKNNQDLNEIKDQIKNGENPTHDLESKYKPNAQAHYLVPLDCQQHS